MSIEEVGKPDQSYVPADAAGAEAALAKLGGLDQARPKLMAAFARFDAAAMADGALDRRTKELIAVAVALTTQCPYCLTVHGAAAREAGASEEELAEVAFVVATMRAGAGVMHAAEHIVRAR